MGCEKLALTKLPKDTFIGTDAFNGCISLALTELPNGTITISSRAFKGCESLAITELPGSIREIRSEAFGNCTSLTNITFKGKATNLYTNIFEGCVNLTTINVPWAKDEVANAPWGATNATINYGKLSAPTLSLDGNTLTITDNDGRATSFDILVDSAVNTTVTTTTFDLSTLGLASGTYSITAIAKADGLTDSSASTAIEYTIS